MKSSVKALTVNLASGIALLVAGALLGSNRPSGAALLAVLLLATTAAVGLAWTAGQVDDR